MKRAVVCSPGNLLLPVDLLLKNKNALLNLALNLCRSGWHNIYATLVLGEVPHQEIFKQWWHSGMCLLNAICAFLFSQHLLSPALQLKSIRFWDFLVNGWLPRARLSIPLVQCEDGTCLLSENSRKVWEDGQFHGIWAGRLRISGKRWKLTHLTCRVNGIIYSS